MCIVLNLYLGKTRACWVIIYGLFIHRVHQMHVWVPTSRTTYTKIHVHDLQQLSSKVQPNVISNFVYWCVQQINDPMGSRYIGPAHKGKPGCVTLEALFASLSHIEQDRADAALMSLTSPGPAGGGDDFSGGGGDDMMNDDNRVDEDFKFDDDDDYSGWGQEYGQGPALPRHRHGGGGDEIRNNKPPTPPPRQYGDETRHNKPQPHKHQKVPPEIVDLTGPTIKTEPDFDATQQQHHPHHQPQQQQQQQQPNISEISQQIIQSVSKIMTQQQQQQHQPRPQMMGAQSDEQQQQIFAMLNEQKQQIEALQHMQRQQQQRVGDDSQQQHQQQYQQQVPPPRQ